ncbi:MAG: MFS transporter [bacterium]
MSKNYSLKILLFISTSMTFVLGVLSPFYALYVAKLGGSIYFAGLSLAVFSIASGVLMLSLTVWETSIKDKKKLYAAGYFLRAVAFCMYIFVATMNELILIQLLLGISIALSNPAFDALFMKHTDKDKEIAEWGGWEGFTAISTGCAALIGGFIIQNYGFGTIFTIMSLASFSLGLYIISIPKEIL